MSAPRHLAAATARTLWLEQGAYMRALREARAKQNRHKAKA